MAVDVVSLPLALAAGVLSFISPCVLPLVPAYLGYIGGISAERSAGVASHPARRRLVLSALCFALGLATAFTLLGASASAVGRALLDYRPIVARVAGAFITLFGLYLAGILRIPPLYGERRLDFLALRGRGYAGAFLMGAAFGVGWTPCVGAILGSILLLASQTETVLQGMTLLFVYSLGLGLPFVAMASALDRFTPLLARVKRHLGKASAAAGALLIAMGVLVFTERLTLITSWLIRVFGAGLAI